MWRNLYSRVRFIFLKCCHENISFPNLMLSEKEWKYVAQQISPAHRSIYFSQLLKRILLSETIVFEAQPIFIWLNSRIIIIIIIIIIIKCKYMQNMLKVNNSSTRRCSVIFTVNFEYIWHIVLVLFCWL